MTTTGLSLERIRRAVAARLAGNLAGINCYAYALKARSLPSIEVIPDESTYVDYWQSFGSNGLGQINLQLRVTTASADTESEQILMDRLLSAGTLDDQSIFAALSTDDNVGGAVGNCVVLVVDSPTEDKDGHYSALIRVQVLTYRNPT